MNSDHKRPMASRRRFGWMALRAGALGFGGSYAVLGRIKRDVVDRERWMTEEEFVEQVAVASALPGTAATNLLTMVGERLFGLRGAVAGAVGFIAPSALLMVLFGVFYERLVGIRAIGSAFEGMSVAAVGVVAAVAVDLRKSALKGGRDWALGVGALIALGTRVLTLLEVVVVAGIIGALAMRPPVHRVPIDSSAAIERMSQADLAAPSSRLMRSLPVLLLPAAVGVSTLASLFVVFARIGVATFGGGFAMIPSIEHEVVIARGWLSERAFGDAIVLGQVTPGPVAIAATFVGYRVAHLLGALVATVGIFSPPFVLSVIVSRSLGAFRQSRRMQGFLRGVAPAVVGVVAAAALSLGQSTIHRWLDVAIAVAGFVLLVFVPRVSPLIVLIAGGVTAFVAHAGGFG